MYYRLKPEYVLRGWKGSAWVLVKRPENLTQYLTQEKFQTLLLCDGETELSADLLDSSIKHTLQQCEEEGLIVSSTESFPLDSEQYYKFYNNRHVRSVLWSITGKCNYRCRHCYMDAPKGKFGELTTQEALNLIDQMAECGILQVDLTGGETFIRKDLWQLIDRIVSHHITIGTVFTNGWLLTENVLDAFEARGLKPQISVSFDGVGWHDWMRGVSGAEEAALRALRLCQKRGFQTDVEMCIHRGNVNTLPQSIELLRSVGVENIKVSHVAMTELWQHNSDGNSFTHQEYIEAMLPYITWYYQAGQPIEYLTFSDIIVLQRNTPYRIIAEQCGVIAEQRGGIEKCVDLYMCGSARITCYITPEGRLLPCMPMTASPKQDHFPRVQEIGLKQGLNDSYYMQFVTGRIKDLFAANPECNSCPYRYRCGGGCRATALLEGDHNLMGCDRTRCMMWKNGYVNKIRQIANEAESKYGQA